MPELEVVAREFITMAHQIVWCSAATIDTEGRPRTRILHPIWHFDGEAITGWIATNPTSAKRRHLDRHPYVSCNYWAPSHDTCLAECDVRWQLDDETRSEVWERFEHAPEPVGYDPRIVPGWDSPRSDSFGVLELRPWRLRVMPGSLMLTGRGELLTWEA